jgi:hypothetical protein
VFALIQGIRWSGATRVLACTAGVAALLLHLTVAGGMSVPGVAQPLWVMAALALNGVPHAPVPWGRDFLAWLLPLPIASAAALLFAMQIFWPVLDGAGLNSRALAVARHYLDLRAGVVPETADGKVPKINDPYQVLNNVSRQLARAAQADAMNARFWADAANWYGEVYQESPGNEQALVRGLRCANQAQRLDPRGEAGFLSEARLRLLIAKRSRQLAVRKRSAGEAPTPLEQVVGTHPQDARLRYRLAEALFAAGEPAQARLHAQKALELDEEAPTPDRRLSERQRQQLRKQVVPAGASGGAGPRRADRRDQPGGSPEKGPRGAK